VGSTGDVEGGVTHVGPQPSFARRTALVALGQAAVKGNQLVVALVLTRVLAPAVWTQVALLLSIYLAAVTLGSLNLQHAIVFFVPRVGPQGTRALVAQTATVMGAIGACIAVGLIAAAPHLGRSFGAESWMPVLALAVVLELPTVCASTAFIATDRLGAAASWDIASTAVLLVGFVGAVALQPTARSVAWGIAIAAAIRLGAFLIVLARSFAGGLVTLPPGTLRRQLAYGLPLGLTLATSVLNRSVDKWLVAFFRPHDLGVYTVAAQEIPLLAVLPYAGGAAVVAMVVDAFRRGDRGVAHAAWLRQTSSMSLVVVPLSIGLIVVASEVFGLAFSPEYSRAVVSFQLFTAITTHRVAEYGLVLRAAGRTSALWRSALVLLAANTVCASVGVVAGGMIGASIGTLIANGIAWWYVIGQMADAFGVGRRDAFAWSAWCAALVTSGVGAMGSFLVADLVGAALVGRLIVKLAVFSGITVGLLRVRSLRVAPKARFEAGVA
jgi:O-antigen/teichoic acid export membrane protein